jgi:putative DNA primase/helicase
MQDLYDPESPLGKNGGHVEEVKRKIVAVYPYLDEEGKLLFEVCRYEPKGFEQRRPDPESKSGWAWGLGCTRRVLWRLPQIAQASLETPVCVFEGESDVLAAERLDLLATTNPGGSGMGWRKEYSETLRGRRVVLFGDNDPPGRQHQQAVAGSLLMNGVAALRVMTLPGVPEKGDFRDFLKLPGTDKKRVIELIRETPEWKPMPWSQRCD